MVIDFQRLASVGLRTGLTYRETATVELTTVALGDSGVSLGVVGHLDKAEALRAASGAVHDDRGRGDLAVLSEELAQRFVGSSVRQVAYKQFLSHVTIWSTELRPIYGYLLILKLNYKIQI